MAVDMAVAVQNGIGKIADYLGDDADDLLTHEALVNKNLLTLPRSRLYRPGL